MGFERISSLNRNLNGFNRQCQRTRAWEIKKKGNETENFLVRHPKSPFGWRWCELQPTKLNGRPAVTLKISNFCLRLVSIFVLFSSSKNNFFFTFSPTEFSAFPPLGFPFFFSYENRWKNACFFFAACSLFLKRRKTLTSKYLRGRWETFNGGVED